MKTRVKSTIPSKEEFEAASKSMAARIRSEEELKKQVVSACSSAPVLHDVFVALPDGRCHVDLFVHLDSEIKSPAALTLKNLVADLLRGLFGRDREISVEIDSDERVRREFNGSYFNRFR